MHLAFRLARRLTALLSIALVLGSVMASGQAKAAHATGLINSATMPCHHALSTDTNTANAKSPLDLCRELCLSQAPDTLVVPTAITPDVGIVTILIPATTFATLDVVPRRVARDAIAPAPTLRRTPPPVISRLLI